MEFINIHTHTASQEGIVLVNTNLTQEMHHLHSIGLHPWDVTAEGIQTLENDLRTCINSKTKAIGEVGLDKICSVDLNLQLRAFEIQVQLAEEFKLPLILHVVKAFQEIEQVRKKQITAVPWIIHGFRQPKIGSQLLDQGYFLSFGEALNYQENLQVFFQSVPLERLFLETDQSSSSITEIYQQAARIKHISVEKLQTAIQHNYHRCFHREIV